MLVRTRGDGKAGRHTDGKTNRSSNFSTMLQNVKKNN